MLKIIHNQFNKNIKKQEILTQVSHLNIKNHKNKSIVENNLVCFTQSINIVHSKILLRST
ncbi:MAG: hypothetical protein U9R42_04040 [Bacteroidota bacterium]|nr:hypothetical protein [Bacteroidota bacterium]